MTTPDIAEARGHVATLRTIDLDGSADMLAAMADELERLRAQVAEWEKLREPDTLHANLLRGLPAQLTAEHLQHLLGVPSLTVGDESPKAENEALRAQVASLSKEAWTWSKALETSLMEKSDPPRQAYPEALRLAIEDLDATEPLGPTSEAVIDAAQRWYLATQTRQEPQTTSKPATQEEPVAEVVQRCMDGGSRGSEIEYYASPEFIKGAPIPAIGTKLYAGPPSKPAAQGMELPELPGPKFWMSFGGDVTGSETKAMRWIANGGSADGLYTASQMEIYARAALAQAPATEPLTDEQIADIAEVEFKAGRLNWAGFEKDASGIYMRPVVSPAECQLVRAALAAAKEQQP